jgi:hypothetical protein
MDFTHTSCKDCDWVEMAQERTPVVSISENGYEQSGILRLLSSGM